MSASTQGPESGRGSAQRVSISICIDGQHGPSHKIRVPALACEGLVKDVKEEVARRAKAQDLVPAALELKHLLADDAVLCDTGERYCVVWSLVSILDTERVCYTLETVLGTCLR